MLLSIRRRQPWESGDGDLGDDVTVDDVIVDDVINRL